MTATDSSLRTRESSGRRRPLLCRVASALLLSASVTSQAQSSVTMLANGPATNRLNIAFLSEGYTSNQLGQFMADATNAMNVLLGFPPYSEYRGYCNVTAIKVASSQSGSDHPTSSLYKDTYFNSSYDSLSDLLITIPPNEFDANPAHGQGKVDALLSTYMPRCNLPVVLVNDPTFGGSDGFDKTALTYVGANISQVLPHETGHVLANLGDEYTGAYPGFPDTEEWNTTTNTVSIKWNAWIPPGTPIPTPPTGLYANTVGLFQGAHYHTAGWYRPQLNCCMGNFASPFCAVCSEALVLAIYGHVRPIDSCLPAITNLNLTNSQAQVFGVALLQPTTHNLTVQWTTNGIAVPSATNTVFSLLPATLPNGTNLLRVVAHDGTSLVLNDPTNLLTQTITWTLNVSIPQLRFDSPLWLPSGKFIFRVSGYAPQNFVIQASTNLVNWSALGTNALTGGQFWYTNNTTGGFTSRFFRAVTPPQ